MTGNVGDTVTWKNNRPTGHSATAINKSFDTGILQKGDSGSATFDTAGSVAYICTPHPFMKGTVKVVAAGSGGGSSDDGSGGGGSGSGDTSGSTSTDSGASDTGSGSGS